MFLQKDITCQPTGGLCDEWCAQYYKKTVGKRILIIGIEPPPFGGVSVHVQRVSHQLLRNNTVEIIDVIKEYKKKSKLGYWFFLLQKLMTFRPQEIHYHVRFLRSGLSELFLLVAFKIIVRSRLLVIEHSARFLYQRSHWYKFLLNRLMYFVDQQVLIGQPMVQAYQDNGIILRNHLIESAFIEPIALYGPAIFARYPQTLHDFLARDSYVILMNASKFGFWHDQDIYGFDFCVRLMQDFVNEPVSLIMAVGTIFDHVHGNYVQRQVSENSHVYMLVGHEQELWPLVQRVNMFVRPSRFDNASVSVAEALWCGVPTVASDVTVRPPGCVLFKTGDYEDFLAKVREVYEQNARESYYSNKKSAERPVRDA
jgi:glycosyltransferase involved in cell wall biosynthesis